MSTGSSDFNYKVALASGLKSLQGGRLRQAEEQFRYLVTHFPAADGGYRGLAKVLIEQEDRPAALRILLDGGAALAKSGERAAAIGLYRDATALDARDLSAHRRLAAALTLAGESAAAAHEYTRYIQSALESGDGERARLEAAYALERIPDSPELAQVARGIGTVGASAPARPERPMPSAAEPPEDRDALMRSAFGGPPPAAPARSAPPPDVWQQAVAPSDPHATVLSAADSEPIAADADALAVEARAARYLAKRDPRGGEIALEAARRYIADGRTDAASDLLLQLIATGVSDHDAQRLLVDVVRTLGRRDVAKAKCQLLVQALRLDGRNDLAAEVEQLALSE